MGKSSLHTILPASTTKHCLRTDPSCEVEESPYSRFLRGWIEHQAALHRELLLNIDAAIGLGFASASS
jgi:hypothetical protein